MESYYVAYVVWFLSNFQIHKRFKMSHEKRKEPSIDLENEAIRRKSECQFDSAKIQGRI